MPNKPILFNAEMVRAILDGRKSCTRKIVKGFIPNDAKWGYTVFTPKGRISCRGTFADGYGEKFFKLPCEPSDILYVRETWEHFECCCCEGDEHGICYQDQQQSVLNKSYGCYMYRATDEISGDARWHPSIHMPKEAARIWLKVTDVRVERLQEIDEDGVWDEGFRFTPPCLTRVSADGHTCDLDGPCTSRIKYCDMTMEELFGRELWDKTIKKSDLDRYGWDANPYVFVIEFVKIDKPEEIQNA